MRKLLLRRSILVCLACREASSLSAPNIGPESILKGDAVALSRTHFLQTTLASLVGSSLPPPPCANAMMTDPKTGIALPSPGEIEAAIPSDWTGVDNPFVDASPSQFARLDSTSDSIFYESPRFVEHVDDNAVKTMTNYISNSVVTPNDTVLDLCSSWTSHFDTTIVQPKQVVGLGMNEKELSSNPSLTSWNVQDLNVNPKLPYPDDSFTVVLCQLSIDYLTKPLQVLKEVGRVLKSGGTVHIIFSNRLFLSKAVGIWTGADDIDHAYTVGCYLFFSNGGFESIQARDLSTRQGRDKRIVGDPLYVVSATKA